MSRKRAAPDHGPVTAEPLSLKKESIVKKLRPDDRALSADQDLVSAVPAMNFVLDYESSTADCVDDSVLYMDTVHVTSTLQGPVPAKNDAQAIPLKPEGIDGFCSVLAECEAAPGHLWFSQVAEDNKKNTEDVQTACSINECALWNLPDVYTSLVAEHLFSSAKYIIFKQASLKRSMIDSGQKLEDFQVRYISSKSEPLPDNEEAATRDVWVRQLIKLANRCGGISKTLARKDHSSDFVNLVIAWWRLRVQDIEATYRKFPHALFLSRTEADFKLSCAMRAAGTCFMWRLPKTAVEVIGKAIFFRVSLRVEMQRILNESMTETSAGEHVDLIGVSRMTKKQKKSLRSTIVKQCGMLARFCGGIQPLKSQSGFCVKFWEFVMTSFNITDAELEKATVKANELEESRPDHSAMTGAMSELVTADEAVRVARETEKAKNMWRISDLSILSRALLARVTVEDETQTYRRNLLKVRGLNGPDLEGKLLGKCMRAMDAEVSACTTRANFSLCVKLAKKFGGLQQLRERGDDGSKFIEKSIALYGHKLSELESGRPESLAPAETQATVEPLPALHDPRAFHPTTAFLPGGSPHLSAAPRRPSTPRDPSPSIHGERSHIFSDVNPTNLPYTTTYSTTHAKTRFEIELEQTGLALAKAMVPLRETNLWKTSNPVHIGQFLYARLRRDVAVQSYRVQLLRERGDNMTRYAGKLISADLLEYPEGVMQELKSRVERDCWTLAGKCGGMTMLLSELGPCRDYVLLVSQIFKLQLGA